LYGYILTITYSSTQKIEVCAQDIQGIIYYIDKNNNVYKAEDVITDKVNPKIIAKYSKNGEYNFHRSNTSTKELIELSNKISADEEIQNFLKVLQ
jgi:hypothetical protein